MKLRALLLVLLAAPAIGFALGGEAETVQAVEFPFGAFPRGLWERELVWLKNIGIRRVAFTAPPVARQGDPRQDLAAFLDLLDRVELEAWVRSAPPEAAPLLKERLRSSGGPVTIWEGGPASAGPPARVAVISAIDPDALAKAHRALAEPEMALLWTEVEDAFTPALRPGAVSLEGGESAGARLLRRHASFLRQWSRFLAGARERRLLPGNPGLLQILSPEGWSLLRFDRAPAKTGTGELRAFDASAGKYLRLPAVPLPAGDSLWLPINWPLAAAGLCEDCGFFAAKDRIVYATAELHAVEWENGILAFEFYAPVKGEIVLQLSEKPEGPFLAAGRPVDFEWDAASSAVRLPIPAGKAPAHRVRIGLAVRPPEQTAFFTAAARLLRGRRNRLSVAASSADLAARLQLGAPAGWTVSGAGVRESTSDFDVTPPPRALHGEFVTLILQDGATHLGHTRVQLLDPVRLRVPDGLVLHTGNRRVPLEPALVIYEPRAGRRVSLQLRNNHTEIANFTVRAEGEGVSVTPEEQPAPVGAGVEREVAVRLSGGENAPLHRVRVRVQGAAELEREFRAVPLRRGQATAYRADFDGDGVEDAALESGQVRAVFSGADGRWLELVWKDTDASLLAQAGELEALENPEVQVRPGGPEPEVTFRAGAHWRTIRLAPGGPLTLEEPRPWRMPAFGALPAGLEIFVDRPAPYRAGITVRLAASTPPPPD